MPAHLSFQDCCSQCPCPQGRPLLTQATARFLETHRPVWLSVLWGHCSFFLSPGVHKVLFVSSKSVFPALWKFCNQIPLASKVKFPGGSQFLCWILRLGNLLWSLELLQQRQDIFCIICGSSAQWPCSELMVTSSRRMHSTCQASQVCCDQNSYPTAGNCWPMPPQETLKHSKAGLVSLLWRSLLLFLGPDAHKVFVCAFRASLVGQRFDFKRDCALSTILLGHYPNIIHLFENPWTVWKGKKVWCGKMKSPGW